MNQSVDSLLLIICFLVVMRSSFLGTGTQLAFLFLGTGTQLAFPFLGTRTQLAFPFLGTRTQLAFPFLGTRTQLPFPFLGTKQERNTPWCHCSSERKCDMLSYLWNGKSDVYSAFSRARNAQRRPTPYNSFGPVER